MYLRGLKGLGEDDGTFVEDDPYKDFPVYDYSSSSPMPVASDTGPTSSFDWTGLFKTALTTYGTIETAKAMQPQQSAAPRPYYSPAPTARPVYSPFTGPLSGGGGAALALGGAGLLAYLLLS